MTRNISYKECTCDICGKSENISQTLILPTLWQKVQIRSSIYDCCGACLDMIEDAIEELKLVHSHD